MHPDTIRKERVWFRLKLTHKYHPKFQEGQLFIVKVYRWLTPIYSVMPGDYMIFLSAWAERGYNMHYIRVFWLLSNGEIIDEYVAIIEACVWQRWRQTNFE